MSQDRPEIVKLDQSIAALALELPESVHADVRKKYNIVRGRYGKTLLANSYIEDALDIALDVITYAISNNSFSDQTSKRIEAAFNEIRQNRKLAKEALENDE